MTDDQSPLCQILNEIADAAATEARSADDWRRFLLREAGEGGWSLMLIGLLDALCNRGCGDLAAPLVVVLQSRPAAWKGMP